MDTSPVQEAAAWAAEPVTVTKPRDTAPRARATDARRTVLLSFMTLLLRHEKSGGRRHSPGLLDCPGGTVERVVVGVAPGGRTTFAAGHRGWEDRPTGRNRPWTVVS